MNDGVLIRILRMRSHFREVSGMHPNEVRCGVRAYDAIMADRPKDVPFVGTVWGMRLVCDAEYAPSRITVGYVAEPSDV